MNGEQSIGWSRDPGPCIILRGSLSNGALWLGYEDNRGNTRFSGQPGYITVSVTPVGTSGWPGAPQILLPGDCESLLTDRISEVGAGRPGYEGAEPIPMFVASLSIHEHVAVLARKLWQDRGSPMGSPEIDWFEAEQQLGVTGSALSAFPLETLIERLPLIASNWTRIEVVQLARKSWQRRSPLRLPLKVQPVGIEADRTLDLVRSRLWFSDPVVQEFGIAISATVPAPLQGILTHDVVLCTASDLVPVLHVIASSVLEKRPRFIIVLGEVQIQSLNLPEGTSLLAVPLPKSPATAEGFVKEVFYGIIHDNPLHAAVKAATLKAGWQIGGPARLVSDPAAIHDLRFKDALTAVLDETLALHSGPIGGLNLPWLSQFSTTPTITTALNRASEAWGITQAAIDGGLSLQADFSRETEGLVPMARALKLLHDARERCEGVRADLAVISADPQVVSAIRQQQERRVDIALLRGETGFWSDPFVRPGGRLETGALYHLRVHIGRKSPASLITEETPGIDQILPDTDPTKGHYLHVVVFPLDFECHSPTMQRVFLPQFSNSEAVVFEVVAPEKPCRAQLRVGVYYDLPGRANPEALPDGYKNHLIQLFLLESGVGLPGTVPGAGEDALRVRLEFSRTSRFVNLDELSDRRLSIAMNDDPQGSHRLMVKGGQACQNILLTELALDDSLGSMRRLLEAVTWDDKKQGPRFPENPPQKPEEEFDRWLRDLASTGKDLYDALWRETREDFQKVLTKFRESSDGVIQIIRLATNYLFPWSALYDFEVPAEKPDAAPVGVCKGFTRPGYTCDKCLKDCLHPDKSKTFCVYGFWGMRHKVEQLLHTPFQTENAITVIKPMPEKAVQVSVGVKGKIVDSFVSGLEETLGKTTVHSVQSIEELLKRLWTEKDRPAILLVLGHYETTAKNKPQITFAGGGYLQPADITSNVQKHNKWTEPNPIVILAACESAAASLASITSFLSAFADARASAVIGTETTVFEGLACRFAKEITTALMKIDHEKRQTLGDAVLQFRRTLLLDFNPLGLVFTPYGDADLHRI